MDTDEYYPIVCNQENFLLKGNRYKVKQCLPNSKIIFKPAIKESVEGRPKHGMFIAIPRELKEFAEDVSPHHERVQAVMLSLATNVLIINSYFPTDPKLNDFDTTELMATLASIQSVIADNDCDSVIWCGDINADFGRNTTFTNIVDGFFRENLLKNAWEKFPVDYTHVYEKDDHTYTSTLDHFFWNEELSNHVTEADVLHLPANMSDHCPVYCKLEVGKIDIRKTAQRITKNNKPSWKRATDEQRGQYTTCLESKLNQIRDPSAKGCCDVHCEDEKHKCECDTYLEGIVNSVKSAAAECLPTIKKNAVHGKSLFKDWKSEVKPFKDTAIFWHAIWTSAGRPMNTALHQVMKRTRNVYHYHIRKCRKMTECIRKNTLLDACINNNGDIFKEIRKIRKTPPDMSSMIDGVTRNIESHFAKVYEKLYNSVEDAEKLASLLERLNSNINSDSLKVIEKIKPELIRLAISKLKNDKTDPIFQFTSDWLKAAPGNLSEHLARLFKMYLIHGHISEMTLVSTIIPLIKDKLGDINSSNNYRSIALSSLILKIFDWVILLLCDEHLSTDELQFGYQEKTSTNMCTWLAVETIDHYIRNGSEVFVGVMDMTKAFDNVKQSLLFEKLLDRNFPSIYLRLILKMYILQKAHVCWNGEVSDTFAIGNGVKQGGVLSPRLFCVYIDDLFSILRRKKTGCWVNGEFVGLLGYADDLLLLAPSRDALQEMISSCEEFASNANLAFSTHALPKKCKTKCMSFLRDKRDVKNIILNGKELPWVTTAKHLGSKITDCPGALSNDLMEKRATFINKVNELNQEFYFAHPATKTKINNVFNSYFYGSTLWNLFGYEFERLEKSWNVSQRILLGLPRNSHRYFIAPLSRTRHIMFSLFKRYQAFVASIESSRKSVLRKFLAGVKHDCRSPTGNNLRHLMRLVGHAWIEDITANEINHLTYNAIPVGDEWKVKMADEVIEVINGNLMIDILSRQEINDILTNVVT